MASDQTSNETRLWGTEDNDNLAISDLVVKLDANGRLEVVDSYNAKAKALGSNSDVATEAAVYTVPANTVTIIDKIVMTNRLDLVNILDWGHSEGGGALAVEDYLGYQVAFPPFGTIVFDGPIYMAATDELRFDALSVSMTIRIYGRENSV
jgi:hypothetical protein